ncbi:MAG: glycosyltransferase family 9 protein [Candidatus Aminicenantes bacterium]|nr:glycosyltransferase family 9 protein [Candidatus Aminicenantes bacterium]
MLSVEHVVRLLSKISSPFLDRTLKTLASSKKTNQILRKIDSHRLNKINELSKVLIIPDINIGDAVITQSFIATLKNAFPEIKINYIYQSKAQPLIKENPHIDHHFPYFSNIGFPSKKDIKILNKIIQKYHFDLIFNLCPYFPSLIFKNSDSIVFYPIRLIAEIIRAYNTNNQIAHFAFQLRKFSREVIDIILNNNNLLASSQKKSFLPQIFATQEFCIKAKKLMGKLGISPRSKKIMFNPDSSSKYTLIPLELQIQLLKGILSCDKFDHLLMNCGFTFKNVEEKLLSAISLKEREKIVVIPKDIGIDVYAALIDNSDLFITADTGPLHIAAARKYIVNSGDRFKNSTAIIGIFGATSAKIYGYDSSLPEYFPAPQDAPSKVFESNPPCKNLTCIDKIFKNCPEVRCFDELEPEEIIDYTHNYLSQIS